MINRIIYQLLVLVCLTEKQQEIVGTVISVHDGDTVKIISSEKTYNVRLYGIDAPELKQEFGQESKDKLTKLLLARQVKLKLISTDRYGRTVGEIIKGKLNINRHMVLFGYAWHYAQYSKDKNLSAAQKTAIKKNRGLWASDNEIPPWEWRKIK